jgi:leucyl-tRNA synthetase
MELPNAKSYMARRLLRRGDISVTPRNDKSSPEARMPENILIAIAWPYANAEIHVGNITGSHLPGDIAARYHRLKGNKVLMVSGTDSHGTPVTLAADKAGKPVEEVYKKYHDVHAEVIAVVFALVKTFSSGSLCGRNLLHLRL